MKKFNTMMPNDSWLLLSHGFGGFNPGFPNLLIKRFGLLPTDVLVFGALINYATWDNVEVDGNGYFHLNYSDLARRSGIRARRVVYDSLKKMQKMRLISIRQKKTKKQNFVKILNVITDEKVNDPNKVFSLYRSNQKRFIPCFSKFMLGSYPNLCANDVIVYGTLLNLSRKDTVKKYDNHFYFLRYLEIMKHSGIATKRCLSASLDRLCEAKLIQKVTKKQRCFFRFLNISVSPKGTEPEDFSDDIANYDDEQDVVLNGQDKPNSSMGSQDGLGHSGASLGDSGNSVLCSAGAGLMHGSNRLGYSSNGSLLPHVVKTVTHTMPNLTPDANNKNFSPLYTLKHLKNGVKPTHFSSESIVHMWRAGARQKCAVEERTKDRCNKLTRWDRALLRNGPRNEIDVRNERGKEIPPEKANKSGIFQSGILRSSNMSDAGSVNKIREGYTGVNSFDGKVEFRRVGMSSFGAKNGLPKFRTELSQGESSTESQADMRADDLNATEGQPGASESVPNTLSKEYQTRGFKKKGRSKGRLGVSNRLEKPKSKTKRSDNECRRAYKYFADHCTRLGYSVPDTIPDQDMRFTRSLVEKYGFDELQSLIDFVVPNWELLRGADSKLLPDPNWNQVVVSWRYEPWMQMAKSASREVVSGEVEKEELDLI